MIPMAMTMARSMIFSFRTVSQQPRRRSGAPFGRERRLPRFAVSLGVLAVLVLAASAGQRAHGQDAAPAAATDWRFPRGDSAATGATKRALPEQLAVAWEFEAEEPIEATPIVLGNRVFVADVMGTVYGLSRIDGKQLWRTSYDTGFLAAPVADDDRLVVGDIEGNVYALATQTGKELWKQTVGGEISGSATIVGDKVLVASQDGKLYCFSLDNGTPQWTYEADDQLRCAPTVAGDKTFLGGCDAKLHVVNVNTGKSSGEPLPLDGPTGSTPAVQGDLAVVPSMDGIVFGFDWKSMKPLWRYEDLEQSQEYRSSAAVSGDVAVVSSQRKHIDAIDIKTGKRLWRHTLRRRADASPVIAGDDVWVPATDGRLLRLSLADGKEKWSYEIRGGFVAPVAIAGDELFVADDEGVVRCFRKPAP